MSGWSSSPGSARSSCSRTASTRSSRSTASRPAALRSRAPGHVVYVDSLSKTVGGGLRVGWIAARGPIFNRLVALKTSTDLNTSPLDQRIAAHYLAGHAHERLLERARPLYRARAAALRQALERHLPGEYDASDPLGGHNLWLTLRRRVDERTLYAEALRQGVGVTPGYAVLAEESQRGSMRLSFSREDEETLDEGVRRLAVALRAVLRAGRVRCQRTHLLNRPVEPEGTAVIRHVDGEPHHAEGNPDPQQRLRDAAARS